MQVIFDDADILVCIKQAGELSERAEHMPGKSVADIYGKPLFTVHRLDRETSGVMVYAKTKAAAAALSEQLKSGKIKKRYFAVLRGVPEKSSGELEDYLVRNSRINKTEIAGQSVLGAKRARLGFTVKATEQGLTLADIELFTGRTHQIRAQFSGRGLPVFGDGRYGGGSGELALRAYYLEFRHPSDNRRMTFTSLPDAAMFPWNLFERQVYSK